MSGDDKQLWVVCRGCRRRLGVEPKWVLKYVRRMAEEGTKEVEIVASLLQAAQADVDGHKPARQESCPECHSINVEHGVATSPSSRKRYMACKDCGQFIGWS